MSIQYFNSTPIDSLVWSANRTSSTIAVGHMTKVGSQISWDSLTGVLTGTVSFQASNDNSIWTDLITPVLINSATGSDTVIIDDMLFMFFRVVCTKNGVTGGTIKVTSAFKE